jgi:hypothetical protein
MCSFITRENDWSVTNYNKIISISNKMDNIHLYLSLEVDTSNSVYQININTSLKINNNVKFCTYIIRSANF